MGDYDSISDKIYVTCGDNNPYQNLTCLVNSLVDKTDNEENKKGEEDG